MTAVLAKIAAELRAIADAADDEHPIDPFEVRLIAIKIEAQAEMIEKGIEP